MGFDPSEYDLNRGTCNGYRDYRKVGYVAGVFGNQIKKWGEICADNDIKWTQIVEK